MLGSTVVFGFIAIQLYALMSHPPSAVSIANNYTKVTSFGPYRPVEDYKVFPMLSITYSDYQLPQPYSDFSENFYAYIAVTSYVTGLPVTDTIDMVPCSSINNTKFQPGGQIFDLLNAKDTPFNKWALCPETGNINYNGFAGTNLWVIPKGNMSDPVLAQQMS